MDIFHKNGILGSPLAAPPSRKSLKGFLLFFCRISEGGDHQRQVYRVP